MMISRTTLAGLVVLLAVPATVAAQEPPTTVDDVLQRLAAGNDSEALNRAGNDATRLLRQEHGPMTAEEIGTLVEGLVKMALAPNACADFLCADGPSEAGFALRFAARRPGVYVDGFGYRDADDLRGVPVPEVFDGLVRIYETLAARAIANGGDDPFLEAAWRDEEAAGGHSWRLYRSLSHVFRADLAPDGRGWAYALALFERSRPPCKEYDGPPEAPDCTVGPGSAWCAAGDLLRQTAMMEARPWPGPDQDLWERRCDSGRPWNRFSDWR